MTILIPAWVDDTLTPVEKLEAHRLGLRHKAVSVFVLHGSDMLLQQRAAGKYHSPGLWANACCTHPDWGETSQDCAHRRLREELGITDLPLSRTCTLEYRAEVGGGLIEHEVVDVFVKRVSAKPDIHPNPDEVSDVAWHPVDEVIENARQGAEHYSAWLTIYMRDHAATILGQPG